MIFHSYVNVYQRVQVFVRDSQCLNTADWAGCGLGMVVFFLTKGNWLALQSLGWDQMEEIPMEIPAKADHEVVRLIACQHHFHPKCVSEWLDKSQGAMRCPLCSAQVGRP